jgi:hypothetical protein
MDPVFIKAFLPPTLIIIVVGLVLYFRLRSRTDLDTGQFSLKSWKLEEELESNPPPRPVKPKDIDAQKKKYYLMMAFPLLLGLGITFFMISTKHSGFHSIPERDRFPLLFIPGIFISVLVLVHFMLKKKIETDLKVLAQGVAVGALVLNSFRQKNQYSYRLRFVYDGKVYERVVMDRFQYLHQGSKLEKGAEVTVLFDPLNINKTLCIYQQMLAEIGIPSPY